MTKSNDNIPDDEMALAKAIAVMHRKGLKWCEGTSFRDSNGDCCVSYVAAAACALGALELAKVALGSRKFNSAPHGNDSPVSDKWTSWPEDDGESLGLAFRCAMRNPGTKR
jgi:hypothetical protein